MSLDRPAIVQAALDLLDEVGIEGLSTRRLAAKLGIRGPSLYWHFKSKRELLDHMAEAMLFEALPAPPVTLGQDFDRRVWLATGARGIRLAALSRRDGGQVLAGAKPTGTHPTLSFAAMVGVLVRTGMTPQDGMTVLQVLGRYAVGWALYEQAAEPGDGASSETGFEFGLQALLQGIEDKMSSEQSLALA
ncbi:TetR/AcrR family transcriptional regulator C-terminal domain-containing protein [soil metagenome]